MLDEFCEDRLDSGTSAKVAHKRHTSDQTQAKYSKLHHLTRATPGGSRGAVYCRALLYNRAKQTTETNTPGGQSFLRHVFAATTGGFCFSRVIAAPVLLLGYAESGFSSNALSTSSAALVVTLDHPLRTYTCAWVVDFAYGPGQFRPYRTGWSLLSEFRWVNA